jgi:hypothetical protein
VKSVTLILVLGLAGGAALVQGQIPGLPSMSGLPNISSIGVGNAAGALGYCVKNKVVGGAEASSVLNRLSGKPDVRAAPGYADGQAGKLNLGDGSTFSLGGAQSQLKSQACNMVLKQAKSFI